MKENLSLFESAPEIKQIDAPQNKKGKIDIPSDKKLLNSLKEIFNNEMGNGRETKPAAPDIENNPLEDKDSGKITLPDGTVIELPDTKEHEKVSRYAPDELVDDNGKQYRTEDGGHIPNNEFTLDGIVYKTDDNGSIYMSDGKYYPDDQFVLNGKLYVTNSEGKVVSDIKEDNQRNESETNLRDSEDNHPIQNKQDGLRRESEVEEELREKYPPEDGYSIEQEVYLRDKNGNIVKDPVTGEARRVDFVVIKDGVVVDSIEVTSKTADKSEQSAKEARIRDAGGNYIRNSDGNLVEIPTTVQTRIERRD